MSYRVLAGIETEYGILVGGRGAADPVDDATQFVRACTEPCVVGWDYRQESPRADLRGFQLSALAVDPTDARFDEGHVRLSDRETRADRVLLNGARFYNDHGHPEYATPECWSLRELALHDLAGEVVMRRTARAFEFETGLPTRLYKNNTDFHGASYGCHESYLAPRRLGFDGLFAAVTPMLVARQVLCGAGKVGSESGGKVRFQLSQRADFMTEAANAETLYRRPVFNTRDEPHADPSEWIRLHVIAGDANRIASATRRKVGLIKLALMLAERGEAPVWRLRDPVRAFQSISRDESRSFVIELDGASHTNAYEVFESYFSAAERLLLPELPDDDAGEFGPLIEDCRRLMESVRSGGDAHRSHIDWAAKLHAVEAYREEESLEWDDPALQAVDLEYHNIDPEESLFDAMVDSGLVEPQPSSEEIEWRAHSIHEPHRAWVRSVAIRKFADALEPSSWSCLRLRMGGEIRECYLDPAKTYPPELDEAADVVGFVRILEEHP